MEYIKLDSSEQVYGKKHLLCSQMEMLSVMKRYESLKKMRQTEFKIKTSLKQKIKNVQDELKILDTFLPKTKHKSIEEAKIKYSQDTKKHIDLQYELDEIKKKLAELQ